MAKPRRPKNIAEGQFFDLAIEKGWIPSKRGWPDFFLERGDEVVAVEVKPSKDRTLRVDQQRVMSALSAFGLPCYVWSPDGGFEKVRPSAKVTGRVGGGGVGGNTSTQEGTGEAALFESPELEPSRDGTPERRAKVDQVWNRYIQVMRPRSTLPGEDDRRIIRNALKVATVEECCQAIDGCRASAYHMGDNVRAKRYNKLSNILKGKRGGKTVREQIDMFLDILEKATAVGYSVTSVDPAVVAQRKEEVRRGHRFKEDPEAVRKAENAEAWLRQQGIETKRRPDGYPIWPTGTNDG